VPRVPWWLASHWRLVLAGGPVVGSRRLVLGEALPGERRRCVGEASRVVHKCIQLGRPLRLVLARLLIRW